MEHNISDKIMEILNTVYWDGTTEARSRLCQMLVSELGVDNVYNMGVRHGVETMQCDIKNLLNI